MIALIQIVLYFLVYGAVVGAPLALGVFGTILVLDIIHLIILGPLAAALIKKEIDTITDKFPYAEMYARLSRRWECSYSIAATLLRRLEAYDRNPDDILSASFFDTMTGEHPLNSVLFRIKAAIKRGDFPIELEKDIRKLFANKATRDLLTLYGDCVPKDISTSEILGYYNVENTPRVPPFYVPTLAEVDMDYVIGVLKSLAKDQPTDIVAFTKQVYGSYLIPKTTQYYINELIYLLYNVKVGPLLTPCVYHIINSKLVALATEGMEECKAQYTTFITQYSLEQMFHHYGVAAPSFHPMLQMDEPAIKKIIGDRFCKMIDGPMKRFAEILLKISSLMTKHPEINAEHIAAKDLVILDRNR